VGWEISCQYRISQYVAKCVLTRLLDNHSLNIGDYLTCTFRPLFIPLGEKFCPPSSIFGITFVKTIKAPDWSKLVGMYRYNKDTHWILDLLAIYRLIEMHAEPSRQERRSLVGMVVRRNSLLDHDLYLGLYFRVRL
jgi:hypothetical protein